MKSQFCVVAGLIPLVLAQQLYVRAAQAADNSMHAISKQVADDAEAQYGIAKRQGDRMQICVQAGMVAAAQLQAQNEASYRYWKSIQAEDCVHAGLERPTRNEPAQDEPSFRVSDHPESLYAIAKSKRDVRGMCIQAGIIADAKSDQEENYQYWKKMESTYCPLAHLKFKPARTPVVPVVHDPDAESLYEIAKRQGDAKQMCVQARIVAAERRAQNQQENYKWWNQNAEASCGLAGRSQ